MAAIPCETKISCDCADGNPLRNLSAETPDVPTFTGIHFTNVPPPLGTSWTAQGCRTVCESTVSQEAADLCAVDQGYQCATATFGNPVNGSTGPDQPPVPPPQSPKGGGPYFPYQNDPQVGVATCGDGTQFTFTQPGGTFTGVNLLAANTAALTYANRQAQLRKICLSDITSPVCIGDELTQRIQATGSFLATFPQTDNWQLVAGALPPGLVFHGGLITGGIASITGTPTSFGSYSFTIQVTDPLGDSIQKTYTMVVVGISNTDMLPDGTVGDPYNFQLLTSGFAIPIFTLATGSPALPDGLVMSSSGHITGTPETEEEVTVTFKVTEGGGTFSCQDDGIFVIVAAGLNWNNLVWESIAFTPGAPNAGSGTGSGTANHYSVAVNGGSPAPFGGSQNPEVTLNGSLTYNGPLVNCQITLTQSNTGVGPAFVGITIFQDGNPIFTSGGGNGVFMFDVADTLGADSTLTVSLDIVGTNGDSTFVTPPGGTTITGILIPAS